MRHLCVHGPIAALAGALVWSPVALAEIYKWVDHKGVTNYSSTPPMTGKARTLDPESVTVSVYPAPPPEQTARAVDAMLRHRVARLENELSAERQSRLAQQAAYQTDSDRQTLAYEQCVKERRVDCDTWRDGTPASAYFYAGAPWYAVGRRFPHVPHAPVAPVPHHPPPLFGATVRTAQPTGFGAMTGFGQPADGSARTASRSGSARLARKF